MEVRSVYNPANTDSVMMKNQYYNNRAFNKFTVMESINTGHLMRQQAPWTGIFNHFTVSGFSLAPKAKMPEPSFITGRLGISMPTLMAVAVLPPYPI